MRSCVNRTLSVRATSALPRAISTSSILRSDQQSFLPPSESSRPSYNSASNPLSTQTDRTDRFRPAYKSRKHVTIDRTTPPPSLLTLADLAPSQIIKLLKTALLFKTICKEVSPKAVLQSLNGRTVALMFSKRSTRTRVASETATEVLGGHPMFLGSQDVQLGVNESLRDTAEVVGSMVDGIMARVGPHSDVETLAKYSPVPVINALSDLYHPTQILADLLTIYETYTLKPFSLKNYPEPEDRRVHSVAKEYVKQLDFASVFNGKKIAWIGDTNNIVNDMMVSMPRLGMHVSVASPKGYDKVDERVWKRVVNAGMESSVTLTNSPAEALKDADIVVTDTWISMGQETEKAARISAFEGYQITNSLVESSGANPDWKFMHCLPRKQEEVDDEVFYGPRSLVFPEAENRKWTTIACFDAMFGKWRSS